MDTVVHILVGSSVAVCIAQWHILESIKNWIINRIPARYPKVEESLGTLLYCAQCIGFWVGIILGFGFDLSWVGLHPVINHILYGFVVSSTATIINRFTGEQEQE